MVYILGEWKFFSSYCLDITATMVVKKCAVVKVLTKGKIALPKKVREELGI